MPPTLGEVPRRGGEGLNQIVSFFITLANSSRHKNGNKKGALRLRDFVVLKQRLERWTPTM